MTGRWRRQDLINFYDGRTSGRDALTSDVDRERWDLGAVMVHGALVDNGGLLGTIENNRETDGPYICDAVTALRSLGLTDAADLVARAEAAYLVMRPNDCGDDLTEEQEELWDELDEAWWPVGEEVERVVARRLAALD